MARRCHSAPAALCPVGGHNTKHVRVAWPKAFAAVPKPKPAVKPMPKPKAKPAPAPELPPDHRRIQRNQEEYPLYRAGPSTPPPPLLEALLPRGRHGGQRFYIEDL